MEDEMDELNVTAVASSSKVTLDGPVIWNHVTETYGIRGSVPGADEDMDHSAQPYYESQETGLEHDAEEDTDIDDESVADDEDEGGDHEAYELKRERQIRANQLLLDSLGISALQPLTSAQSLTYPSAQPTAKRKNVKRDSKPVYDRSGYILSLPLPGERNHRIACVEIPADRGLKRRIAEGEYQDVEHWWEGEERRWRFGHGRGEVKDGEEWEVGGVTKEFRWRKWKGLEKELRREMRQRKESNRKDKAGVSDRAEPTGEVSAYSLLPGEPCNQCRRKSDKPKMKCRNVDPLCRAVFCETCCKRYSYFAFDSDSRSFICPLCKDCCNCANCIRKRKLSHLLGPGKTGVKAKTVAESGMTVQAWLEKAAEDKVGVPFDRVRLVDQEWDVISPDLPEEPVAEVISEKQGVKRKRGPNKVKEPGTQGLKEITKGRKRKARTDAVEGEPRAKAVTHEQGEQEQASGQRGLVIKIKVPKASAQRVRQKEVDSDGDTVGGYSDDEEDDKKSEASSKLTSLSSRSNDSAPPHRLPFPSRPVFTTNDYLASIAAVKAQSAKTAPTSTKNKQNPTLPVVTGNLSSDSVVGSIHAGVITSHSRTSSGSGSDGEGGRKRKKPPPKANIVRQPRHSISPNDKTLPLPPVLSETHHQPPLNASDAHYETMNEEPVTPWPGASEQVSFQSFSYDGYSTNLPPVSTHIGGTAYPPQDMMIGYPPPYSHSPPRRQNQLPGAYGPPGFQRSMHHVQRGYAGSPYILHHEYQPQQSMGSHVSHRAQQAQLSDPAMKAYTVGGRFIDDRIQIDGEGRRTQQGQMLADGRYHESH